MQSWLPEIISTKSFGAAPDARISSLKAAQPRDSVVQRPGHLSLCCQGTPGKRRSHYLQKARSNHSHDMCSETPSARFANDRAARSFATNDGALNKVSSAGTAPAAATQSRLSSVLSVRFAIAKAARYLRGCDPAESSPAHQRCSASAGQNLVAGWGLTTWGPVSSHVRKIPHHLFLHSLVAAAQQRDQRLDSAGRSAAAQCVPVSQVRQRRGRGLFSRH